MHAHTHTHTQAQDNLLKQRLYRIPLFAPPVPSGSTRRLRLLLHLCLCLCASARVCVHVRLRPSASGEREGEHENGHVACYWTHATTRHCLLGPLRTADSCCVTEQCQDTGPSGSARVISVTSTLSDPSPGKPAQLVSNTRDLHVFSSGSSKGVTHLHKARKPNKLQTSAVSLSCSSPQNLCEQHKARYRTVTCRRSPAHNP